MGDGGKGSSGRCGAVRFLLDNNLPRSLAAALVDIGPATRHVADLGMSDATDREIVAFARAGADVIVTHDLDFGHLLAFSGEASPSVIILRVSDLSTGEIAARIRTSWADIAGPLAQGAIVIVEDRALRIRLLPVAKPAGA